MQSFHPVCNTANTILLPYRVQLVLLVLKVPVVLLVLL